MRSLPILFFLSLTASLVSAMSAIDRLGISCPTGSLWYVCQASGFIGCCAVDPCQRPQGVCPLDKLAAAGFNGQDPEVFALVGAQGCGQAQANVSNGLWYTCSANIPPFMGCCTSNPCGEGCPEGDLRSARMNHAEKNPFADYEDVDENKGLSKGAIAGIAAGVGVLVVLALAVGVFFFLRKKKKAAQAPPVPAKNDAYLSHHSNPHDPMSQFSPVPHSAHPSQHGSPYPFSPQVPVPNDSKGYYFPGTPQPGQQQIPGSPPYYPNTHIPILHPAHAAAMGQSPSPFDSMATSHSPVSTHSHYQPPVVAAELPAMPDQPSRHSMILRAASTTTYKGSSNGHTKRESAASHMTAPPEAHHTHNHQLAELGETQITAEMGDSIKRDPNSPR
ncbi:hypothetical protein HJFPF1_09368 [Paramyrothecium foliicola]|nr:hypothetical protein HJFPF1_09368 [Paramyrothecium foliicola]